MCNCHLWRALGLHTAARAAHRPQSKLLRCEQVLIGGVQLCVRGRTARGWRRGSINRLVCCAVLQDEKKWWVNERPKNSAYVCDRTPKVLGNTRRLRTYLLMTSSVKEMAVSPSIVICGTAAQHSTAQKSQHQHHACHAIHTRQTHAHNTIARSRCATPASTRARTPRRLFRRLVWTNDDNNYTEKSMPHYCCHVSMYLWSKNENNLYHTSLSSYRTMSLPRPRWPPKEHASEATPSWRHPSPQITYVKLSTICTE